MVGRYFFMLSKQQEKILRSLRTKKGREQSGLCLVEGKKALDTAGDAVQYTFTRKDTDQFDQIVTTETPQNVAGVARIPTWTISDLLSRDIVIALDGVQDPGNVGAILRLCLGFKAGLILIDSADVTNEKVIRSSVGAMFHVPWIRVSEKQSASLFKDIDRPIYRLEKKKGSADIQKVQIKKPVLLLAGSEGQGIRSRIKGTSVHIAHDSALESLNVGHALAIALSTLRRS